ncbi:MAG TPA: YicC/YloC family endoribonuclease [Burkholderiales bacterium]|nr:YicC/YloC family endoribonuclease [Burkholderiales bacterium]
MTGYAAAAREFASGVLNLELRSVNHRYLDIQFRLPDELRSIEPQLREQVAARISRGKVECRVTFVAGAGAQKALQLNDALLRQLISLGKKVRDALPEAQGLGTADVLRWPGMLGAEAVPVEELREPCRELLAAVLGEFASARSREGERLKTILLERVASIESRLAAIGPRIPHAVAAFQEKLTVRLKEALAGGDDERIRQEVTVFATKIDVDEELSRLATHVAELKRILLEGGAVGKRLDFLIQELNRETNTVGSKSVDLAVTQSALELKVLIEQMREQIQNIE